MTKTPAPVRVLTNQLIAPVCVLTKRYHQRVIFSFALLLILFNSAQAQHSGNQVFRNSSEYYDLFNNKAVRKFAISPTAIEMNVSVLLNQKPDKYVITLSVDEEDKTPKLCLAKINSRITKFIAQLKQYGIARENIFTDFISQIKIYDFNKDNKDAINPNQLIKGFSIKKNVIIQLNRNEQIEQVISEASEQDIYDIVKVDYINTDMEAIYARLLGEAKQIVEKKQADYVQKFNPKVIGTPTADDKFYYSFPKDQYRQYEASEVAGLSNYLYNDYYLRMISRRNKTSYYEGLNYSGFDKVINNADPEPCIQYVLTLAVRYELAK